MDTLIGWIGTLLDLTLVIAAFGSIVFLHELGHFVAARWAGIRVTAFALGWGPPVVSWRRGVGLRRGTSAAEAAAVIRREGRADAAGETEYRLSWFPLGGYVKMVGQEDLGADGETVEAGSWQATAPWKRMIVISAGVVMNLITAAILFVVVFSVGLKTEPPLVGGLAPGSPAAQAVAVNAEALDLAESRLLPGDRIVRVNGDRAEEFTQIIVEAAMSRRGAPVKLEVERAGVAEPLEFAIVPERGPTSGLLELGLLAARSNLIDTEHERDRAALTATLARLGYEGIDPGSRIVGVESSRAGLVEASNGPDLVRALEAAGREGVTLVVESPGGQQTRVPAQPEAVLMTDFVAGGSADSVRAVEHLLGLTPVMRVSPLALGELAPKQGLMAGDVFARVGQVEFPALHEGIAEIRANSGRALELGVLRSAGDALGHAVGDALISAEALTIPVEVSNGGTVGFIVGTTEGDSSVLARAPMLVDAEGNEVETGRAASRLIEGSGARLVSIGGVPVSTLSDAAFELRTQLADEIKAGVGASVEVGVVPVDVWLGPDAAADGGAPSTREWTLTAAEVARLGEIGSTTTLYGLLAPEEITLRGEGLVGALGQGFRRTKQVMSQTYLTLARLFHGTVRVEHLRGPVGIAHVGTQIADRGLIWLLFFTALVSVNLAVINFLPLPIVDGGQFLLLLYEQIRGKAAPQIVQELSVLAGIVLIAGLFLVVTFNDLVRLFGG
ncbi:MAG: site-2 protease family protein [Planctomycetota bacterium]